MPGRSPADAVAAFLDPLREAMACLGGSHFDLTRGARGAVGTTHMWTLNGGEPVMIGPDHTLTASMHFETQDQGQSLGQERYRVTTRGYMYAVCDLDGAEIISAHWHPSGPSPYRDPHWHLGSPALAPTGVFLERAHIASPRVSFEFMIRWCIETIDGVAPACEDWRERLERTESQFEQYKTW